MSTTLPTVGDRVELLCGLIVVVEKVIRRRTRKSRRERFGVEENVDLQFTHPRGFNAFARWSGDPTLPHIKRLVSEG